MPAPPRPPLHPWDRNLLAAARFDRPDWIPVTFRVDRACWKAYPQEALVELMADHPLLFPGFHPPPLPYEPPLPPDARAGVPFTDRWGCLRETTVDGILGTVTAHPLERWAAFDAFVPPAPVEEEGGEDSLIPPPAPPGPFRRLRAGGLPHGHTFQRLCDLRGYVNLTFDLADGDPRIRRLASLVESYNLRLVEKALAEGAEWMTYPDDLGMQSGPMISPGAFAEFILPSYMRLMEPARRAEAVVHCHCDGDIRALVPLLLRCPLAVLNLQDLVNGIDWIASELKGRVAVDLDVDRTEITVRGTPAEIDALIRREVETLSSPEGGLLLTYSLHPGTPLENARAVADALERYAGFHRTP